jgi:regulator of nonsense transcripts 2
MRTQQQVERAEQQRIKNLVLNYDMTDDQHDGEAPSFHYIESPNSKRTILVGKGSLNKSLRHKQSGGHLQHPTSSKISTFNDEQRRTSLDSGYSSPPQTLPSAAAIPCQDLHADSTEGNAFENPHQQPRADKSGNTRRKQRARQLQLGDIDWYGRRSTTSAPPSTEKPATQTSLDSYVVDKTLRVGSGNARPRDGGGRRGSQQRQASAKTG